MTWRVHITFAALFTGIFGLLSIAAGALLAALRGGGLGPELGDPTTQRALLALQVMTSVHGGLAVLAAWGIYHLRPWGRVVGIVLGATSLLSPVLGVAYGVYVLWALLSEGGSRVFTERDRVHLYTEMHGFGGAATQGAGDERPPPCACAFLLAAWSLLHLVFYVPLAILHGPDPRAWPRPRWTGDAVPAPPAQSGQPGQPPGATAPPSRVRRVRAVEGLPGHYTYTDETGRTVIVDDFDEVPERYR